MKLEINNVTIRTVLGDITKVDFADIIVNSASNSPVGGSGINSAIHKAAGKKLMEAYKICDPYGRSDLAGRHT